MSHSRDKVEVDQVDQSSLLTSLPKDLLLPAQNAKQDLSITSVVSDFYLKVLRFIRVRYLPIDEKCFPA